MQFSDGAPQGFVTEIEPALTLKPIKLFANGAKVTAIVFQRFSRELTLDSQMLEKALFELGVSHHLSADLHQPRKDSAEHFANIAEEDRTLTRLEVERVVRADRQ